MITIILFACKQKQAFVSKGDVLLIEHQKASAGYLKQWK